MTAIYETAYPRIRSNLTEKELVEIYTPTLEDLAFVEKYTKTIPNKLGVLVLLKVFQRLGYFPAPETIDKTVIQYIAQVAGIHEYEDNFKVYTNSDEIRWKHLKLIRNYLDITAFRQGGRNLLDQACIQASYTRDVIADIINAGIECLIQKRYELPAFSTFLRAAQDARAKVNKGFYQEICQKMTQEQKYLVDSLFEQEDTASQSLWQMLKQEPKKPTIKHIRDFSEHLEWLKSLNVSNALLNDVPEVKFKRFAEEAKSLNLAQMKETQEKKRLTLAIALISVQTACALDDLTEMLIKNVLKIHIHGRSALEEYQANHQERADYLIGVLEKLVNGWLEHEDMELRNQVIGGLLNSNAEEIQSKCEAHLAHSKNKYIPFLPALYKGRRSTWFRLLLILRPVSTSSDKSLEEAIRFLLRHQNAKAKEIPTEEKGEKKILDLSWIPEKWWPYVTNQRTRHKSVTHVDRKYFELCVFSCVVQELKSSDLCVLEADDYGDFRNNLLSIEEFELDKEGFCEQMGYSSDPEQFAEDAQKQMRTAISDTDKTFPKNSSVSLKDGALTVKKIVKKKDPPGLQIIDKLLLERMPDTNIVDILSDTEHWLNWTSHFGLVSGYETRIENAQERYLTAIFCYGCNLGPTQTARSIEGTDRKQVAYINTKYINEEKLLQANTQIINQYNRFGLPKYWGSGESASADGTKWDVYEQNLLSEYHIRYGGWGGIGYYHVSDTYIALFSTFISCGVWEAVHILDGLLENTSDIRPDTLHADTQGQSETVFGLSYLLGIKLMPRIRNWKDLKLYLPEPNLNLQHLTEIFTETIDWNLIKTHLTDMMRVALSISKGKIRSSTVLRKLNTYSRKSRLYFAFRELGRAVRTQFLMRYAASEELRRMISAATNTSEAWNGFIQWLAFGGHGVIGKNNRQEQQKMIRYNHLVGNLVIFHNVVQMTSILKELIKEGHQITPEILSHLAPYRTAHINRFGNYELMETIPEPIDDKLEMKLS